MKPVLHLLGNNRIFAGAHDEFCSALKHYRHNQYKECVNDCLKAFESLMKAIHEKHSWQFNQNYSSQKLIQSCLDNGLIPKYLQSQLSNIIKLLLECGVPTIRNKVSSHGQGTNISTVPEHLASYTIHLTATNLLFLARCEEQL